MFSVLCGHDKTAGREPDSPCFMIPARQTPLETKSASSICSRDSVAHRLASGLHLPFEFFPLLFCLPDSPPPRPPSFNLAQGARRAAGMHINTAQRQGPCCRKVKPAWRHTMRCSGNLQPVAGLRIASPARNAPLIQKRDTCWRDSV